MTRYPVWLLSIELASSTHPPIHLLHFLIHLLFAPKPLFTCPLVYISIHPPILLPISLCIYPLTAFLPSIHLPSHFPLLCDPTCRPVYRSIHPFMRHSQRYILCAQHRNNSICGNSYHLLNVCLMPGTLPTFLFNPRDNLSSFDR